MPPPSRPHTQNRNRMALRRGRATLQGGEAASPVLCRLKLQCALLILLDLYFFSCRKKSGTESHTQARTATRKGSEFRHIFIF